MQAHFGRPLMNILVRTLRPKLSTHPAFDTVTRNIALIGLNMRKNNRFDKNNPYIWSMKKVLRYTAVFRIEIR